MRVCSQEHIQTNLGQPIAHHHHHSHSHNPPGSSPHIGLAWLSYPSDSKPKPIQAVYRQTKEARNSKQASFLTQNRFPAHRPHCDLPRTQERGGVTSSCVLSNVAASSLASYMAVPEHAESRTPYRILGPLKRTQELGLVRNPLHSNGYRFIRKAYAAVSLAQEAHRVSTTRRRSRISDPDPNCLPVGQPYGCPSVTNQLCGNRAAYHQTPLRRSIAATSFFLPRTFDRVVTRHQHFCFFVRPIRYVPVSRFFEPMQSLH